MERLIGDRGFDRRHGRQVAVKPAGERIVTSQHNSVADKGTPGVRPVIKKEGRP